MEILDTFLNAFFANGEIILAFFAIAILYSSVGFGGGSSYIALLSLFGLPFVEMRALALFCNITVVSGNIYGFIKRKEYQWKKVLPLVLMSIPLAYLGGKMEINKTYFTVLLSITLIVAAVFMLLANYAKTKATDSRPNSLKDFSFGGIVGFISGMIGIGGGIFLAPLLHITKWDTPKKIAATSSLFIFVNSIAGLIGQAQNVNFYFEPKFAIILIITVFIGGQIGSRMQEKLISPILLKRITAILILSVGIKLLIEHFF